MLRLYDTDGITIRTLDNIENFCINHVSGGLDTLTFDISPKHDLYKYIAEEIKIEYGENDYLIKKINKRKKVSTIECEIDLDEWKTGFYETFSQGALDPVEILTLIKPSGWTIVDNSYVTETFAYDLEKVTSYDIFLSVQETFNIAYKISKKYKTLTLIYPDNSTNIGAYFTDELNLTELLFKGDSDNIITRLYAYGKDDLTIESVNSGLKYVDNFDYCDKIIVGYWKDERYTIASNLKEASIKKLKEVSTPERAYTCTVVDLAKVNSSEYGFLTVRLYDAVTLIDRDTNVRKEHNVVEYKEYPSEPNRNVVTLSSVPKKIENSIKTISTQIANSNKQGGYVYEAVKNATELITGQKGGYIVLDPVEKPERILIMDTPDITTATKVWQWNLAGLGYSNGGINGTYGTAITMDGSIVANYITSGTMAFDRCYGGTLTLGGIVNGNGICYVKDSSGNTVVTINNNGILMNSGSINLANKFIVTSAGFVTATSGLIGGWNLTDSSIYRTSPTWGTSGGMYFGTSGLSLSDAFTVSSSGNTTIKNTSATVSSTKFRIVESSNTNNYCAIGQRGVYMIYNDNNIINGLISSSNTTLSLVHGSDAVHLYADGYSTFSGSLSVSGTKNRVVSTENYGDVLHYCYETTSPYFGDIGESVIEEDGKCYIDLDDVFRETIASTCNYQVFTQKYNNGEITSIERHDNYFIVKGTVGLEFAWEVKAKQKDYNTERLENLKQVSEENKDEINYENEAINTITDYEQEMLSV